MFGEEEAGQPHSNKEAAVLIAYEAVGCGLLTDMVSYLGGRCASLATPYLPPFVPRLSVCRISVAALPPLCAAMCACPSGLAPVLRGRALAGTACHPECARRLCHAIIAAAGLAAAAGCQPGRACAWCWRAPLPLPACHRCPQLGLRCALPFPLKACWSLSRARTWWLSSGRWCAGMGGFYKQPRGCLLGRRRSAASSPVPLPAWAWPLPGAGADWHLPSLPPGAHRAQRGPPGAAVRDGQRCHPRHPV